MSRRENKENNLTTLLTLNKECNGTGKKVWATCKNTGESVWFNVYEDRMVYAHHKSYGLFVSRDQINEEYYNFYVK